jgi:hypothetical protein
MQSDLEMAKRVVAAVDALNATLQEVAAAGVSVDLRIIEASFIGRADVPVVEATSYRRLAGGGGGGCGPDVLSREHGGSGRNGPIPAGLLARGHKGLTG